MTFDPKLLDGTGAVRRVGAAACLLAGLWTAAPLSLAQSARSQLPDLGDISELTSSTERRMGDRIAREIYRDPDYIDDPVQIGRAHV